MELAAGLPFIEMHVVEQDEFDYLTQIVYGSDRNKVLKGMIEMVLR